MRKKASNIQARAFEIAVAPTLWILTSAHDAQACINSMRVSSPYHSPTLKSRVTDFLSGAQLQGLNHLDASLLVAGTLGFVFFGLLALKLTSVADLSETSEHEILSENQPHSWHQGD
jgi:hypothetical protein